MTNTPQCGDAARAFITDTAEIRRALAIERLHVATDGILGVNAVESAERMAPRWDAAPMFDVRTIVGHPDFDPDVARASFDALTKAVFANAGPQPQTLLMTQETATALTRAARQRVTPSAAK